MADDETAAAPYSEGEICVPPSGGQADNEDVERHSHRKPERRQVAGESNEISDERQKRDEGKEEPSHSGTMLDCGA